MLFCFVLFFLSETIFHFYCSTQVNNSIFSDIVDTLCDFLSVITVLWLLRFSSRPVRTANVAVILHFEPPILMFSVQKEDKGSVCTCAGEHLNKCIVFVQKSANSCLFYIYTHIKVPNCISE